MCHAVNICFFPQHSCTAPDHVAVIVSAKPGWRLQSASVNSQQGGGLTPSDAVPLNGQPTYYFLWSHGLQPEHDLSLWFVVEKEKRSISWTDDGRDAAMEMLVVGSYQHGPAVNQSALADFRKLFPSWALTIPATATVDVVTFH